MSDDNLGQATILGGDWMGDAHRSLSVKKIENGYTVDAKFTKKRTHAGESYDAATEKRYCFYSLAEVITFVTGYFEAPAEELQE